MCSRSLRRYSCRVEIRRVSRAGSYRERHRSSLPVLCRWCLHFFSLRSGGPHPLAASPIPSRPPHKYRDTSLLQLVVARNYVAVLMPRYQLKIYDWKAGHTVIVRPEAPYVTRRVGLIHTQCITSPVVQSVVFLPENRILLGATHIKDLDRRAVLEGVTDGPVLAVYNLDEVPASGGKRRRPTPAASFALEFGRDVTPVAMFLRYCPNVHSYSSEVAVPFFGSPEDHLIALQATSHLSMTDARHIAVVFHHTLLIPIATLLNHVSSAENRRTRHIQWDGWGTTGTRRVPSSDSPILFRDPLSGSRYLPRRLTQSSISVWDFGRARVGQFQTSDSKSVPFVQKEVALPSEIRGRVATAIGEDVIVICEASIISLSFFLCPTDLRLPCHF